MIKLSVILPVFNEENNPYFKKILSQFLNKSGIELIVVDGGSTDNTLLLAKNHSCVIIKNGGTYRAERLNKGIEAATGDVVLLHHPRSIILDQKLTSLLSLSDEITWGAFTHKFDHKHILLSFTSWYSNNIRPFLQGVFYLDHCIFFKSQKLHAPLVIPNIPIFEDTELCKILKKSGKPHRLKSISVTSSLRFQKNGFYKQALMNQVLKFCYFAGVSKERMDKFYEKGLSLNSKK